MKNLWLALALFVATGSTLFANGGAWQTGIPATGNASASKNDRHTDVTIENETLKIDLHPEHADVTVRYRIHNTGPKVQQDFFFPVERWGKNPDSDNEGKSDDIDRYQISVDGKELKSTNVAGPKQETSKKKEAKRKKEPAKRTRIAAKRKKKPAKRRKEAAKRKKKAAKRRKKPMKRLRGCPGNKRCPPSSHGRNLSFPSRKIRRGRW